MAEVGDEIDRIKPRRSYLVTYSKANLEKFPTRESFAEAVVETFVSKRSCSKPQHWACCIEKHADGDNHYHLAMKLTDPKKWLESKRAIQQKFEIVVNFSDHGGYYSVYKYICKHDDK